MSDTDYQKILKARAARAVPLERKALSPTEYQNQQNLKDYADRKLRHHVGLPVFHVKRPWWKKVLRCGG